jgi:hypothetical protein
MRVAAEAAPAPASVSAAVARVFPEAAEAEVQAAQAVLGAAEPAGLVLVVPAVEVVPQSMPVICGVRRDRRAVVQAEELPESGEAELVLAGAVELASEEAEEPVLAVAAVLQATLAFPAREVRREGRLENG